MNSKLAQGIIKFRWLIIITVVIITAFFTYQIKNLEINSDVIESLPDEDPDASLFKKIASKFGSNNMGMVILETDNIYSTEVLEHVKQITDSLKTIEGIYSVTSLTSIIDIKGGDYGIEVGKLIDDWFLPESEQELANLRERVNSKDMYRGTIVSEDGTATIVIFTLTKDANIKQVARKVISITESLNIPEKLYYAGSPMMVTAIADLISKDLFTLLPIAFLVIAIILYFSFRTLRGVVLPLLTSGIAILWTIGILAMAGFKMSMISNNIPIILLAVGSAYTIHVLNRINMERDRNRKKAVTKALTFIFIPVLLAAITTAVGFISFVFGAYLTMIRDFGIFTAMGTAFACLLSLFFAPAIISAFWSHKKMKDKPIETNHSSLLSKWLLTPLKNVLFLHPKRILIIWGVLLIISIGGIFLIKRSVDIQDYFKEGNPTRTAENIMINKFGGSKPIFVLFKGDMQSPEVLKTILKTEEFMKESPDVITTQSVANLIADLSEALGEGREIPDDKDKIEQLWFLLDGQEMMSRFVTDNLQEGIILTKFTSPDNISKKKFAAYMNEFIKNNSSENCQIQITGMPFVDVTMDKSLLRSQMGSLTIAVIFVIIIVGLILRSLLNGLYATLPIIAAIAILYGVMGYAGISLNIATVLVASVALGIGIDYSIHTISHFNNSLQKTGDIYRALRDTIMISGKAIFINVISVSGGFLVLLFSEMVPLQYFGLLIALSMIGSGLGALTLLPVILILVNRKKIKN